MAWEQKLRIPEENEALPGRAQAIPVPATHFVSGAPLQPPFPADMQQAIFALGCFWGAERRFWETPGVFTTAVGYAGGSTPNPSYEEVCRLLAERLLGDDTLYSEEAWIRDRVEEL